MIDLLMLIDVCIALLDPESIDLINAYLSTCSPITGTLNITGKLNITGALQALSCAVFSSAA